MSTSTVRRYAHAWTPSPATCPRKCRPTTRLPISRPWTSGKTVRTVSISSRRTRSSRSLRSRLPGMAPSFPTPARSRGWPAGLEGEDVGAPVRERRQHLADALRVAEVDVGHDDAFAVAGASDDGPPRIHDHR